MSLSCHVYHVCHVCLCFCLCLCPALPYLVCVSRCSCGAASTAPYPSLWRPLPSSVTGTCHARLHSAEVPCAENKVPVVAGTWPPAHQYNASTPLFQGEPFFFSSGTFTRDCRLGRPSSWGAPVTTTVDTPPSHSFILRLALRVSPPTVCFCRACMCMQFAGWPRVGPPPEPKTSATARDSDSGSPFRHCPMSL